jgi:RNA polymerase sigma-70 factor (ECF subfamily)
MTAARARSDDAPRSTPAVPSFETVYDQHADLVWRSLRRLGLDEAAAEDALQEVFMVVHRRLPDFEGRSTLATWLFGIILFVVRNHRRTQRRKRTDGGAEAQAAIERLSAADEEQPDAQADRARAVARLYRLLDELSDEQREVFVMAELEQMRGTEIARATGVNLNTVYTRRNAARRAFDQAVARMNAGGRHE